MIIFGSPLEYGSPDVFLGLNATWRIFHTHICKISLYYEFFDAGNDQPITEILAADIYMISSTGGIDCALNVWNLAGKHFLMFCKKLNAMQKTYHLHYVGKISIQN